MIQPHGLDLAKTRHIPFGSFNTPSVRFNVFLFFPESARTPRSRTSASSNALSLDRQKDLYDNIILPAAYETIPDPFRQEIPRTFDAVYTKSRSYQERPAMGRWKVGDENRSFSLAYTLPARALSRFWRSVVDKANQFHIATQRGEAVAYFRDPRLLFQSHDVKNTFARPSLQETIDHFEKTVLVALNPKHLDIHSCWLDIGTRDYVVSPREGEPCTILWKSQCNRHLQQQLQEITSEETLEAAYFRSFLLRDIGNITLKAKPARRPNLGHPDSRQPGIPRFKAYSCNKELFSVMFSSYRLFHSESFPLLALSDGMIQDLASMSKDRQRAYVTQLNRASLLHAWEANKRHVRAVSDPKVLTNYGIRKEGTFRLDIILTMLHRGVFDPERSPHTGQTSRSIPLRHESGDQYPFWIVPTRDINALVFTQAARLILPLDHLFQEVSLSPGDQTAPCDSSGSSIRQILSFYTAQILCRLLILNFCSERELSHDKWIWLRDWRVRGQPGSFRERRGLGLEKSIDESGMLWIPRDRIDWRRGHIALDTLIHLYIQRSPLQASLASQSNIQALTTSQLTVEFYLQEWIQDARQAFEEGRKDEGRKLADRIIRLAAEEIARAYNQHLLAKMQSYWERVRNHLGRSELPALSQLRQAKEDSVAERSRIVTAQTILEIYMEAWAVYTSVSSVESLQEEQMPREIPCWVKTRKYQPPKDNWMDFVFEHLLARPSPPTWDRIYFRQVYRTFKSFWEVISRSAGSFDDRLRGTLGRYIMVTFNSDQVKEVGTNHTRDTWYHGKPSFFQMQYWAPYFSPPQTNRHFRSGSVSCHHGRSRRSTPDRTLRILTTKEFQAVEKKVHRDWLQATFEPDQLHDASQSDVDRRCRRTLRCVAQLAGPTWGSDGRLEGIIPWRLGPKGGQGHQDQHAFHVPVPATVVAREGPDSLQSEPTIMLPTRHNVMGLLNALGSFPDVSSGLIQRLRWVKCQLRNDGRQYEIPSHLEAKKEARELTPQSRSLLRQFLSQKEPPEWHIEAEDINAVDMGSDVFDSDETETATEIDTDFDVESDDIGLLDELESLYYIE